MSPLWVRSAIAAAVALFFDQRVIYATPYNYGYQPPPVVYDNTPGFTIRIQ